MELQYKNKKIFAFADSHGAHRQVMVPADTDILICAGDAVEDNLRGDEYDDFLEWFSRQPCRYRIFVPGNHELSFDIGQADGIRPRFEKHRIILLEDALDDFGGIAITSISGNSRIADEDIPEGTDILVTHPLSPSRHIGRRIRQPGNPELRPESTAEIPSVRTCPPDRRSC